MQGIWVNGRRPKTKKELKEAVRENPARVTVEATSLFGNEYDGSILEAPLDEEIYFVGPDPYTKRNWYGMIVRTEKGIKIS